MSARAPGLSRPMSVRRSAREQHAGPGGQLVRVDPRAQPGPDAGREDRPRLVGVEGAPLAEGVDPGRVWRGGGEHLATDQIHVAVRVAPLRYEVGAEVGGLAG